MGPHTCTICCQVFGVKCLLRSNMTRAHANIDACMSNCNNKIMTTYNEEGNEYNDRRLVQPFLVKFPFHDVLHDVFKFYDSFKDETTDVFTIQPNLSLPLHSLST